MKLHTGQFPFLGFEEEFRSFRLFVILETLQFFERRQANKVSRR